MSRGYDREGESIVTACACARTLHLGDGAVVRKLQACLARMCVEYAKRTHPICEGLRAALLEQMTKDIEVKGAEIMKEVGG